MYEDDSEPPKERILHVYSYSNDHNHGITENYILHDYDLDGKHRFRYKFNIKNVLQRRSIPRKFPRTLREHTDFDKRPGETTCPNCLNYIKTKIYRYSTGVTHAIAASLFPIGMCIIPYCINKYKNTAHYCPRCKIYLGTKYGSGRNLLYRCTKTLKCR